MKKDMYKTEAELYKSVMEYGNYYWYHWRFWKTLWRSLDTITVLLYIIGFLFIVNIILAYILGVYFH